MAESYEAVIIGAGLLGASVARECALRGLRVALVEQGEVASGASSVGQILLGDGLPTGGDARALAGLAALAPHLVTIIPVEDVGLGTIVDVTRLTQLYVLDAVERGAHLSTHVAVKAIEQAGDERSPTRRVRLVDGRAMVAPRVVVATGATAPDAEGIDTPQTRAIRVVDVDVPPPDAGRLVGDLLLYPTRGGARLFLPDDDEAAVRTALDSFDLGDAPISRSEVHEIAIAGAPRTDAAPGLVRVSESGPGAHRDVATYLADAFARETAAGASPSAPRDEPLPGGDALVPTTPLAERHDVSELSVRALVSRHGSRAHDVLARTTKAPRERAHLCACEAILECEVRYACRVEGARSLSDVARRTTLGAGPCHGADCAHRAAQIVREETGGSADAANDSASRFLRERYERRAPFLRPFDVAREELLRSRSWSEGLMRREEEPR